MRDDERKYYSGVIMGKVFCSQKCKNEYLASQNGGSVSTSSGGIGGFFADIFLPVGIVLSLVGKSKTDNQEKVFNTMLTLDLIFTGLMFFIAITCCTPRH